MIKHDAVNEQIVLAACIDEKSRNRIVARCQPDTFLVPAHKIIFKGVAELVRRKLDFDVPTLLTLADIEEKYLRTILESNPTPPRNLEYHLDLLHWDKARHTSATGPLAQLAKEISDPRTEPERIKSLARQVSTSFDGYEERSFLVEGGELVRSSMAEIEKRRNGHATYLFGIDALDFYEEIPGQERERRLIPGPAPKTTTVITGVPGSGKSTTTAHVINGLRKEGRRVIVGAWEMPPPAYIELLALLECGFSRSDVAQGRLDDDQMQELQLKMEEITDTVRFMDTPFFRQRGEKRSNDRHLDIIQGYIADSGCNVFVADLFKRALVRTDPDEEELALIRQQSMAVEMNIANILIQQQRSKDVEARPDKRPTREGIKGSGAWTEIADLIIGVHRPALWKRIDDKSIEWFILKQRYGKWPLGIEVEWDPEFGSIGKGKSIPYDQPGENESSDIDSAFAEPKGVSGRKFTKRKFR